MEGKGTGPSAALIYLLSLGVPTTKAEEKGDSTADCGKRGA